MLFRSLSSIVLASLNSARKKSRDARRVADVKQVQLALELFFDASSTYPLLLSELAPTYIAAVPSDPLSGTYTYNPYTNSAMNPACTTAGTCLYYHLGADLEAAGAATDSDRDATVSGGINGDDANDCAGDAGRVCYDVTP